MPGKKADVKDDILFSEGKFRSTACEKMGFTTATYTSSGMWGRTKFKAELINAKGDKLKWTGKIKGDKAKGTALLYKKGSKQADKRWFKGELKPMAVAHKTVKKEDPKKAAKQEGYKKVSQEVEKLEGTLDQVLELFLGDGADHLINRLAPFKEDNRRNSADAEFSGGFGAGVDVHLEHLDLAGILGGDLFNDRRQRPARGAPGGPKINQHRLAVLQDIGREILIGCNLDVG